MLLVNANPINQPIEFTQGEGITLTLLATDDQGNPVNLTGGTFSTQILGPNSVGPITFPDVQHQALNQNTNPGQFTLTLSSTDTGNCGEGANKQIITQVNLNGVISYFRGNNLLTVYPAVPLQ